VGVIANVDWRTEHFIVRTVIRTPDCSALSVVEFFFIFIFMLSRSTDYAVNEHFLMACSV